MKQFYHRTSVGMQSYDQTVLLSQWTGIGPGIRCRLLNCANLKFRIRSNSSTSKWVKQWFALSKSIFEPRSSHLHFRAVRERWLENSYDASRNLRYTLPPRKYRSSKLQRFSKPAMHSANLQCSCKPSMCLQRFLHREPTRFPVVASIGN